jgi:MFS family permease
MMMAFDHFVAIIRPLHYPLHMRKKRSIIIILALWGFSFVLGFSDFLTGFNKYYFEESLNYCESVYLSLYNDEYAVFVIAGLTLIIMFYIYTRIYLKIRALQRPGVKVSDQQSNPSDLRRNKRALITTLLILGTFMLFWMPMCIYQITLIIYVNFGSRAIEKHLYILITFDRYLYNLLQLNAISDPIIYAVRMYEVQLGYKRMFRMCFPCFSNSRALNIPFYESAKGNPRSNGSKSSVRHHDEFIKPLDQATTHSEYLMVTKRSELPESNADDINCEQEHQFS